MYSRKYVTVTEKGKYRVRNSKRTAQLGKGSLKTPDEAEYSVCWVSYSRIQVVIEALLKTKCPEMLRRIDW
jgi:hypothetical protein